MRADADRPSWRTTARRRAEDIAFIAHVRDMAERGDMFGALLFRHHHERAPLWKRVAIARCIEKIRRRVGKAGGPESSPSTTSRDP